AGGRRAGPARSGAGERGGDRVAAGRVAGSGRRPRRPDRTVRHRRWAQPAYPAAGVSHGSTGGRVDRAPPAGRSSAPGGRTGAFDRPGPARPGHAAATGTGRPVSAPSTPAAPTDSRRYHIRPLTLLSLLAGRGTYRLVQLLTTVLLLMAWGEPRYQVYAAAMSSFSWLTALVFTGPEKTVLKLLPRAPRTGPMITEALLAVVWLMPIPLVVAFAVSLGLWGEAVATIYLGVAAMLLGSGCTM